MEEPAKDALTAILQRLRLQAGIFVLAEFCGTWAVDTSGHRKVPFHLIGRGTGWLHAGSNDEPRQLNAGDLVVFPHDAKHVIASGAAVPPIPLPISLSSQLLMRFDSERKIAATLYPDPNRLGSWKAIVPPI